MAVTFSKRPLITLSASARKANLTSQGLLKILKRKGCAIRNDGHWFVDPAVIEQIVLARRVLGIERKNFGA